MAHVRSLSQQLSDLESLNTALEEHTKAIQAAAVASTADWRRAVESGAALAPDNVFLSNQRAVAARSRPGAAEEVG